MVSSFVEHDALTAHELFALQSKRTLHAFRGQGKPIAILNSQEQVARLESFSFGKSGLRETGAGSNDCTILARVADTFDNQIQCGITRRIRPGTQFRVARRGRCGATLCVRRQHGPRLEALCLYCQVKASFFSTKIILPADREGRRRTAGSRSALPGVER